MKYSTVDSFQVQSIFRVYLGTFVEIVLSVVFSIFYFFLFLPATCLLKHVIMLFFVSSLKDVRLET